VRLGIKAMQVATVPPLTVNWAGSETVSAEDYCAYLGQLVDKEVRFRYDDRAPWPLWPDVTKMHEVSSDSGALARRDESHGSREVGETVAAVSDFNESTQLVMPSRPLQKGQCQAQSLIAPQRDDASLRRLGPVRRRLQLQSGTAIDAGS